MLDEFEHALALLARHPGCGHRRPDLDPEERLRFWSVHSYLVAYLPDARPLFITRILHGARDPEGLRSELEDDEPDAPVSR